jgi:hypothetical protein
MLDAFADQGASLRQPLPPAPARLITLVSQGEQDSEQALLWQLCLALHNYGYPPIVLDGTSLESQHEPGLIDRMQHTPWSTLAPATDDGWGVIPAAEGLRALARLPHPRLDRLSALFQGCGVVVLYARAELLIPVLADSTAQPVLALAPGTNAMLRGYRTLKQLQEQAGLVPTLVSLASTSLKNADQLARSTGRSLQKCALTFLGCDADMITVRSEPLAEPRPDDVRRLAVRLLDGGAVPSRA